MSEITLAEAARRAGVTPATLRRWAQEGVIPQYDGQWTLAAAAHARIVARLRERGHSLEQLKQATNEGRLAYGILEDLFPVGDRIWSLESPCTVVYCRLLSPCTRHRPFP